MSRWTDLRRTLAHLIAAQAHGRPIETLLVPMVVRGRTADRADLRVLLDGIVEVEAVADRAELERMIHAIVVPGVRRWLAERALADLPEALPGARPELEAMVQPELEALGTRLLRLDLVAVEHLLVSPSADPGAEGAR